MAKYHIAQSGKKAGEMVKCPAKNFCTLRTADGQPVHHGNFVYDKDANNWNRIEQVIANGGNEALGDSKDAMNVLENAQSLSDGTVQAVLENESANQMGATVKVLPRKALEELAKARKAIQEQEQNAPRFASSNDEANWRKLNQSGTNQMTENAAKVLEQGQHLSDETVQKVLDWQANGESRDWSTVTGDDAKAVAELRDAAIDSGVDTSEEALLYQSVYRNMKEDSPEDRKARKTLETWKHTGRGVRKVEAMVSDPNTPLDVAVDIGVNTDYVKALSNSAIPSEVLDRLSKYDDDDINWAILRNRNISGETVEYIARKSESDEVLADILEKHHVSDETVEYIADKTESDEVLASVINNSYNDDVSVKAASRLKNIASLEEKTTNRIAELMDSSEMQIQPDVAWSYYRQGDQNLHAALSRNGYTPRGVLDGLYQAYRYGHDGDSEKIRDSLASNRYTPSYTLREMFNDWHDRHEWEIKNDMFYGDDFSKRLAENINTPDDVREQLDQLGVWASTNKSAPIRLF